MKSKNDYYTPNEVAKLLMVAPGTVRQWAIKGELSALTTPGGHRRFLHRDIEQFARKKGLALPVNTSTTRRILVVDDDKLFANYLVELLDGLPGKIETELSYEGFNAGQKILTFKPDTVLLDLMMPNLSGFDVCKQIKQNPATKSIVVVTLSGRCTPENIEKSLALGAKACLAKPVDEAVLLKEIGL